MSEPKPVLVRESGVYEKVDYSATIARAKKSLADGCPKCKEPWKQHFTRAGVYRGCA